MCLDPVLRSTYLLLKVISRRGQLPQTSFSSDRPRPLIYRPGPHLVTRPEILIIYADPKMFYLHNHLIAPYEPTHHHVSYCYIPVSLSFNQFVVVDLCG